MSYEAVMFFRPFGARSAIPFYPRLAPWAAFFRRCAAGSEINFIVERVADPKNLQSIQNRA